MGLTAGIVTLGLTATSCTTDRDPIADSPATINFIPRTGTRAMINGTADLESDEAGFKVWSTKHSTIEAGSWAEVFDNTPASLTYSDGNWNYDGGLKYWDKGYYYTFHALYPASISENASLNTENASELPTFTITDFDCTNHVDLLYASHTRDYDNEGGTAVPLTFQHLLIHVTFVGKADANLSGDGISVKLTSVKLYGEKLSPKNTCTLSATGWSWNHGTGTTESEPFVTRIDEDTPNQHVTLQPGKEFDLFTETDNNDLLIIPQEDLNGIYFSVGYEYSGNGITTSKGSGIINLGNITNATKSWEAGKSYKYTFTIGASDYIMFNAPTVTQWQPANLGEIVDK